MWRHLHAQRSLRPHQTAKVSAAWAHLDGRQLSAARPAELRAAYTALKSARQRVTGTARQRRPPELLHHRVQVLDSLLHSLIVGLHPPLDGFDVRRQRERLGVLVQRAAQTSQPAFDAVRGGFNPLWDGADAPIPSFDSLHRPGSPGTHPVENPRRDLQ